MLKGINHIEIISYNFLTEKTVKKLTDLGDKKRLENLMWIIEEMIKEEAYVGIYSKTHKFLLSNFESDLYKLSKM